MTEGEMSKTALHGKHVAREAKMGSDGGWEMPLSFSTPGEEVAETCRRASVFDISHVGRIRIRGDEALDLVERVCTADVVRQEDDTARYTLLCNESGGVIDQCLAVRIDDWWLLTTSPINRAKVLAHLRTAGEGLSVKVDDQTDRTSMVCVAGPDAEAMLERAMPISITGLAPGQIRTGTLMLARYIAIRTAYMGLWALEVVLPTMFIAQAWRFITDKAGQNAAPPAGAIARDVLRIQAANCRYGHELNETIDPFMAGLGRAVDFGHEFIGIAALEPLKDKTPARQRVGLVLAETDGQGPGGAIPTLGTPVCRADGGQIGTVTSGTFCPALGRAIAMAYVAGDDARLGADVLVGQDDIHQAKLVSLPFAC